VKKGVNIPRREQSMYTPGGKLSLLKTASVCVAEIIQVYSILKTFLSFGTKTHVSNIWTSWFGKDCRQIKLVTICNDISIKRFYRHWKEEMSTTYILINYLHTYLSTKLILSYKIVGVLLHSCLFYNIGQVRSVNGVHSQIMLTSGRCRASYT
jgi:hypothetical protein